MTDLIKVTHPLKVGWIHFINDLEYYEHTENKEKYRIIIRNDIMSLKEYLDELYKEV